MPTKQRLLKLLALVFAFALIAAACGSDDDDGDSTEGTDGTGGSETDTTEAMEDGEPDQLEGQTVQEEDVQAAIGDLQEADPLGDRGPEPSGTLDFGWHTGFIPAWFLPLKNTASVSQFATQYVMHDAVCKNTPDRLLAPSLAESYLIADDFTSATFTLRDDITFHNGEPVTTADVEFSYLNYTGANSAVLQDNLDNIEIVDDRTITFNFNQPFLDFVGLYCSTATGAAWVIPKAYYEEVGEEGFIENPIGAGPFKFVENQNNTKIVYEANTDYWKKNPGVQTLNWGVITDPTTRLSALSTGEIDLANVIPGDLLEAGRNDPNVTIQPSDSAPFWLEFVGIEDPENPFNDVRVREAVTLALDREAINQAETGGAGETTGQWIPRQYAGALQADPIETNIERAKELMAEAGYADGFDAGQITPLPNYFTLGERIITMLGEIGITTQLNQMERGVFLADIGQGKDGELVQSDGIIVNISGAGGDAAARVQTFATCDGSSSRICYPEIDEPFAKYKASTDPAERTMLLDEIQQFIIDNHILPYAYTLGLNMAQGPDVVEPPDQVWNQIPQYPYPGLWEDIHVKE